MVELDLGDGPRQYRRETNTMPQWAGSCWYYLRYLDPDNDQRFVDPVVEKFWMAGTGGAGRVGAFTNPVGRYVSAAEVEETPDGLFYQGEPVKRHYGKMGKSLKNSISPDEIYQSYGADTLRMYEMAMGPLDVDRPWQPDDIVGVFRFLQRLWRNVIEEERGDLRAEAKVLSSGDPLYKLTHRTINEVTGNFDELRFNVAIARMIELNNALTQFVQREDAFPRQVVEALVLMTFRSPRTFPPSCGSVSGTMTALMTWPSPSRTRIHQVPDLERDG
jgi:leucyl-tRNA synthetase